jgi:hypothetical protein
MLDRVTIVPGNHFRLGDVAEALVYYGHVELVVSVGTLVAIVKNVGIDLAIELAESRTFSFLLNQHMPAVLTNSGDLYQHTFTDFGVSKDVDGTDMSAPEDAIFQTAKHVIGPGVLPRAKVKRLAKAVKPRKADFQPILDGSLADVKDQAFAAAGIRSLMRSLVPDYPNTNGVTWAVSWSENRFNISSNIDFNLADSLYKNAHGIEETTITPAYLLAHFIGMRWEMFFSGHAKSDIWADDAQATLLRCKVNSFLARLERGRGDIDRFQEVAFFGRSFGEAVNSGERSLAEVIEFVADPQTQEFKSWIKDGPENGDLLREYDKARLGPSKLGRSLPVRAAKVMLFTVMGGAIEAAVGGLLGGVAGNVAVSAADEMLFSKLKVGWRPNQWVANRARPFLTR